MKREDEEAPKRTEDLEKLYSRHGARVYRFCYRLSGNSSDAEDLTMEVFLAACTGLKGFRALCSPTTWLFQIAVHKWKDMQSKRRIDLVPLEDSDHVAPAVETIQGLLIDQAIGQLTELEREAFLLVRIEGFTHRESAFILQVPQGTVQSRVFEADKRLRAFLSEPNAGHSQPRCSNGV